MFALSSADLWRCGCKCARSGRDGSTLTASLITPFELMYLRTQSNVHDKQTQYNHNDYQLLHWSLQFHFFYRGRFPADENANTPTCGNVSYGSEPIPIMTLTKQMGSIKGHLAFARKLSAKYPTVSMMSRVRAKYLVKASRDEIDSNINPPMMRQKCVPYAILWKGSVICDMVMDDRTMYTSPPKRWNDGNHLKSSYVIDNIWGSCISGWIVSRLIDVRKALVPLTMASSTYNVRAVLKKPSNRLAATTMHFI